MDDRFLRFPASCGGSKVSSASGDPDIGGVGREAQQGSFAGFDKVKSKERREEWHSSLCCWNEGAKESVPKCGSRCIRLTGCLAVE